MSTGPGTVADWYPDPSGRHQSRYWDGRAWTGHVADDGVTAEDPVTAPVTPPASPVSGGTGPVAPTAVAEEYADIALQVTPEQARDAVVRELAARGFRVAFHDPWNATAERGSKGMNVAFGALAQYFRISVQIFQGPAGETVVRLLRDPVGYWGGLVGRARVSGTFKQVVNDLISAFHQQGLLVGVGHQG